MNQLTTLLRKLATSAAGLEFLINCRDCCVFPAFISRTFRFAPLGRSMHRLARKLPMRLLRATIRDVRARLANLDWDISVVWSCLFRTIRNTELWNTLVSQKDTFFSSMFAASTDRLRRKFRALCANSNVSRRDTSICPIRHNHHVLNATENTTAAVPNSPCLAEHSLNNASTLYGSEDASSSLPVTAGNQTFSLSLLLLERTPVANGHFNFSARPRH